MLLELNQGWLPTFLLLFPMHFLLFFFPEISLYKALIEEWPADEKWAIETASFVMYGAVPYPWDKRAWGEKMTSGGRKSRDLLRKYGLSGIFWGVNKWLKSAVMSYVRLKYISEERFTKCKILLPVSILVFRSCFTTGRAAACQTNVARDKKGGNLHVFGTPFCACHLHVAVYIIANLFSWTSTFGLRQALWYLILPLQHSHLPAHLVSCLLSGWSSKMEIFPCFLSSSGL